MGASYDTHGWGGARKCVKVAFLGQDWLGTDHAWTPSTFAAYRHPEGPGSELGGIPGSQQAHSSHSTLYGWGGGAALLSYLIPSVPRNLTLAF